MRSSNADQYWNVGFSNVPRPRRRQVPQGLDFETLGFSSRSFAGSGCLSTPGGAGPVTPPPRLRASFNMPELTNDGRDSQPKNAQKRPVSCQNTQSLRIQCLPATGHSAMVRRPAGPLFCILEAERPLCDPKGSHPRRVCDPMGPHFRSTCRTTFAAHGTRPRRLEAAVKMLQAPQKTASRNRGGPFRHESTASRKQRRPRNKLYGDSLAVVESPAQAFDHVGRHQSGNVAAKAEYFLQHTRADKRVAPGRLQENRLDLRG